MDEFALQDEPPRRTGWLLIFTDLLSLMLTFFVLLFSMTEVKMESWRAIVEAFSKRPFPTEMGDRLPDPESDQNPATAISRRSVDLGYLHAILAEKLAKDPLVRTAAMRRLGDRLVLSLPAADLFAGGGARVTAAARGTARVLADMLGTIRNRIEIYGYVRPGTKRIEGFASNWELSLAQAGMMARTLRESGLSRKIPVFGFADSRFHDLSPGLPEERRLALGHRIDLVIHEPDA